MIDGGEAMADHGDTISISRGGGVPMWSFRLATLSTKACVDQALC